MFSNELKERVELLEKQNDVFYLIKRLDEMDRKIQQLNEQLDLFRGFQYTVLQTIRRKSRDEKITIKDIHVTFEEYPKDPYKN